MEGILNNLKFQMSKVKSDAEYRREFISGSASLRIPKWFNKLTILSVAEGQVWNNTLCVLRL